MTDRYTGLALALAFGLSAATVTRTLIAEPPPRAAAPVRAAPGSDATGTAPASVAPVLTTGAEPADVPSTAKTQAPTALSGEALAIAADRLDIDVEAKTAALFGNVKLSRGSMTVSCPRVDARYDDAAQIVWAKGTGGVVASIRGARAEAPEVTIDVGRQLIELRGGVRIARGEGFLKAEQATFHMTTGKVSMTDVKGSISILAGRPSP